MRKNEKQQPEPIKKEPVKFCGQCEKGWTFKPDQDYPGRNLASPCYCNERGREDIRQYAQELRLQGLDREPEKVPDFSGETAQAAISLFGATPEQKALTLSEIRKTLSGLGGNRDIAKRHYSATVELARTLYPEEVRKWGLQEWEMFNLDHPDPLAEIESKPLDTAVQAA